jgi:hypothetical protein
LKNTHDLLGDLFRSKNAGVTVVSETPAPFVALPVTLTLSVPVGGSLVRR